MAKQRGLLCSLGEQRDNHDTIEFPPRRIRAEGTSQILSSPMFRLRLVRHALGDATGDHPRFAAPDAPQRPTPTAARFGVAKAVMYSCKQTT